MKKIILLATVITALAFADDCSVQRVSAIDPAIAAKFTPSISDFGHDRYVFDLTENDARVKIDISTGSASAFNTSKFCVAMYTKDSLAVGAICAGGIIDYGEIRETEYVPQGFFRTGPEKIIDLVWYAVLETNE